MNGRCTLPGCERQMPCQSNCPSWAIQERIWLVVQVRPLPGERGRKAIYVDDGVKGFAMWGSTHMHQHGGRGTSFTFRQLGNGETIQEPYAGSTRRPGRMHDFKVYGDKMARRALPTGAPTPAPVEERLLEAARDLIARKLLRDPMDVRAEEERRAIELTDYEVARESEELEKFRTKAREIVAPYADAVPIDKIIPDIVAAMKWAQAQ